MNFSVAAKKLGISQPTLTQALQKAEADLGVALFERQGRELTLTSYGKVFLDSCGYITDLYNETLNKINDLKFGRTGAIRLGIAPSRAPFTLPSLITRFRACYPNVRLDISESLTADIEKKVEKGLFDLGILVQENNLNERLESIPIESESIVIAVHKSLVPKSIAAGENCNEITMGKIKDFANTPFVLLGDTQLIVSQFLELCEKEGVALDCVARCKNVETSLSLANTGIGATLVTSTGMAYYKSAFPELRYVQVTEKPMNRHVCVIYRKNQYLDPPLQKLIELIKTKEI